MSENIGCYGEFDATVRQMTEMSQWKKNNPPEIQKYCESADEDFAC